jgi:parallel beta-helix repeat protein
MSQRQAVIAALIGTAVGFALALAFFTLSGSGPAKAGSGNIYTVDTASDALLAGCGSATPADCSLRGAISRANAAGSDGDIIRFDASVFPAATPATISISTTVGPMTGGLDSIDATDRGVIIDASNIEPSYATFDCLSVASDGNTIRGLRITDCKRGLSLPAGADNNSIDSNIVYDNEVGLFVEGNNNQLNGNRVGTNAGGTATHPDGGNHRGIVIRGDGNQVGGSFPNIISGNGYAGLEISLADFTVVAGNYIGTDVTGNQAIPNPAGVSLLSLSAYTTIGGNTTNSRNVISGNLTGISIGGGSMWTAVAGNYIGVAADGRGDLGNSAGISIQNAARSCIGGTFQAGDCTTGAGTRNVISGNNGNGVGLLGLQTTNNSILGNYIGLGADGVSPLGNDGIGIYIDASITEVGSINPGDGNRIAYNTAAGVRVDNRTGNSILSNEIFSNGQVGIDLYPSAGVTPNDPQDTDTGANNLQNFPVLTSATSTSVQGTLNSTPGTEFFIQFFDSATCDPSGFGEGEHLAGTGGGVTNLNGDLAFSATVAPVANGRYITAVAAPNGAPYNSSEFSNCVQVGTTALPDSDGDGVPNTTDTCPNWPNPSQAMPVWALPANDPDCDGFTSALELYLTTTPTQQCAATGTADDELSPDFWPLDTNDSRQINTVDVGAFVGKLGLDNTEIGWTARLNLDQSPNGIINTVDVGLYVGRLGIACSPSGP